MVHTHYSPFQFATEKQAAENNVSVKAVVAPAKKLIRKVPAPSLMSCADARSITGSPNAFISPNSVDVMRTVHSVFGN